MLRKRKPQLQPGYEGRLEVTPFMVDSVYEKGKLEPVVKNIRESSIATMHARGSIDDAQRMAAEWFRAVYERTRIGSMAIDPSHEPVDTSGRADPIPDRAIAAVEELAHVRYELGRDGYTIVQLICGQGWSIKEVAGLGPRRAGEEIGVVLRRSLDLLAEMRGYATKSGR